jgi:hypothetical protein
MTLVNNTPDNETIPGSFFVNTLPHTWEEFIAKIPGINILTILAPINDYDPFDDTTQIDEADPFLEDVEDIIWDFEAKTNFDFGWSCRC